ncbi:NACHT domain-containing protein [Streptomyces sp. NPDC049585]|uniref:NACHT domain-containing protein n=1 Tax=Streptomyces sp. NPDC049585 TaxID=3155154 RepID=UPI003413885B
MNTGKAFRANESRLAAVLGERQGSGVLLTSDLVLTSAHVVGSRSTATVLPMGGYTHSNCDVVWRDTEGDAALLHAGKPVLLAARPTVRLGTLAGDWPVPDCQALGFPQVQRYAGGQLEAVQVTGTVMPVSGRARKRYVLRSEHHPPADVPDGSSPWAGLSGGPVFAGPVLLGLITEDSAGWDHSALATIPIESILFAPGFSATARAHGLRHALEIVGSGGPADLSYEDRYAKAVKARYSRMEIFGLDDLGTNENSWDLDTAYLSLEALTSHGTAHVRSEPQRIEEVLARRPRAVLRGEAGAGKTTLVWWLASHAICRTMPEELTALNGLIPFVVPMRSLAARGITTPAPAQLPTIAQLQVDEAPAGWAGRVLEMGRALLLVDGLDELPRAERGTARRWLADLLRMYPATRCLVTARPLAVERSWLESEGFEELQLLPMSDHDIQEFVAAWHRAARLECGAFADPLRAEQERNRLIGLERDLSQEFERSPALRDLARTPLLCAVICALHRRRSGLLPRTRWHLYEAALAMLLGNRDAHRRIGTPEGIALDVEDGRQLLQRIAIWLVRNGRAELSHEQAVRQLEAALQGLRKVREQGSAEQVLAHLLNRSGLLQERATDSLQFIHRTFQDYLAAKEFQDSDSLGELLSHAAEEQWQDVVRLVIGHCGRGEVRRVVAGLIAAGDAATEREARWSLRTLAAECAQSARYLDDEQHEAVWEKVKELGPPLGDRDVELLSSLGPDVLSVLPSAEGLHRRAALHVVHVLTRLGDAAIPSLALFGRLNSRTVRHKVADAWARMDARTYAEQVLARMKLSNILLAVGSSSRLELLPGLGPVGSLLIRGDHPPESLARAFAGRAIRSLDIRGNQALRDLDFLADHPDIQELRLSDCPEVRDITALQRTSVRALHLRHVRLPHPAVETIAGLPALSLLSLDSVWSDERNRLPPPHPGVSRLWVTGDTASPLDLNGIDSWTGLQSLSLAVPLAAPKDLGKLAGLSQLRSLKVRLDSARVLVGVAPLPEVRSLALTLCEEPRVDTTLFTVFPGLRTLRLTSLLPGSIVLDLSGLPVLPEPLEVWPGQSNNELELIDADRFGDRLEVRGAGLDAGD